MKMTPMIQELTVAEEADLILLDVFDQDQIGRDDVLNDFCEENGLAYSPENEEEIQSLIIDHEDELMRRYQLYKLEN